MVAGADVIHQSIPVLDVPYRCVSKRIDEIVDLSATAAVAAMAPLVSSIGASSQLDLRTLDAAPDFEEDSTLVEFIPSIRSGSFADIGPRTYMEDEHIRIDDLSGHLGPVFTCPTPCAFYGVFDGHGGQDAAAYLKSNATRLFFEDGEFPRASEANTVFIESVENSVRKTFLQADLALADECSVSTSSGTTALTALVLGRTLLVANVGDCRAVLCRKGEALEMSQDHRPIYSVECRRVEESGGYIVDGYLNGVLSVSRALGDWEMKLPKGSRSPLIAEPEFRKVVLTKDDEFLIIGCDGVWDVMSSQHAVSVVRRGLRRHDDPERCARELAMEALRLRTFDNLTVIVVCFTSEHRDSSSLPEQHRPQQPSRHLRYCRLSTEALCNLRSWLEKDDGRN